jgi:O-antigen ligase
MKYRLSPEGLTFGCACLLVAAINLSPFVLALSMWGFVAAAYWQAVVVFQAANPGVRPWLGAFRLSIRNFGKQPAMWGLALLLLAPAISFFWSTNTDWWLSQTRVRLPFLILPWAFANLPVLSGRQYKLVLYWLVWVMVVLCIGVGINLGLHYDQIVDDLNHGRPIPVPRSHIRFNLILATAILSGGWLVQQQFVWKRAWERKALIGAVIFLFLFIHVLSVRSGLAALYAALMFTAGWVVVHTGRWKLGIVALVLILMTPVIALKTIPSLQNRIDYMRYDWQRFRENAGGDYSDAQRWVSLQVGWMLWQEHPWIGTGAGDLPMEVQRMANDHFPNYSIEPKLPHNQFLFILSSTGLLGIALSLLGFLAPFLQRSARRFYLFFAIQVIIFVSFLVEYTLETAIGVAFYLFFTLWFMKMSDSE